MKQKTPELAEALKVEIKHYECGGCGQLVLDPSDWKDDCSCDPEDQALVGLISTVSVAEKLRAETCHGTGGSCIHTSCRKLGAIARSYEQANAPTEIEEEKVMPSESKLEEFEEFLKEFVVRFNHETNPGKRITDFWPDRKDSRHYAVVFVMEGGKTQGKRYTPAELEAVLEDKEKEFKRLIQELRG